jgi:amino acid transporter
VAYIAYRGVVGATGVNIAINVIQISALLVFAVIAIGYRASHPQDSVGWTLDPDGKAVNVVIDTFKADDKGNPVDKDGKSLLDKDGNLPASAVAMLVHDDNGKPVKDPKITSPSDWETAYIIAKDKDGKNVPFTLDYTKAVDKVPDPNDATKTVDGRLYFEDAKSVVAPHAFSFVIIQACVAILILVGFESVTSMGEEAKNAKRDIPRAVLLSLTIQGAVCYLIEYFAANYALNNGYTMTTAAGSGAPIGDMMKIIGAWLFGSPRLGWWFMFIEAITVFLALIGTTLSCINTGARVTYAMGRDDEVPSHFGMLHGKNLTPHRAIWTLAAISTFIGIIAVLSPVSSPFSTADLPSQITPDQQHSIWYPMSLIPDADHVKTLPNTLLVVTLISNFGTFLLYMLTCIVAIVAFREHKTFNTFKHTFIPLFGLVANLACMIFYLVGPFTVYGMSWKEPYIALGIAAIWAIYGWFYFARASAKKGKVAFLTPEHKAAMIAPTS